MLCYPKLLKKQSGTDIFYQIIAHVHFREILSGYFLFSRFDWSILSRNWLLIYIFSVIYPS
jgi:hypothetical protein